MKLFATVHRIAGQSVVDECAGVANPARLRWLALMDVMAWVVSFFIAWSTVFHTPQHSFWHATIVISIAFPTVAYLLMRRRRRARAYQRGWLDGRRVMLASIEEAIKRDMTLVEWVHTEIERDQEVIDHL